MSAKFQSGDKVIYKDNKEYKIGTVFKPTSNKDVPYLYSFLDSEIIAKEWEIKKK